MDVRKENMTNKETEQVIRVGRVKDAHGIKGEIFITLFAGEAEWLNKLVELHLVSEAGEIKRYSIKSARLHKKGLIVKTGEIRDRNEAESLKGWFLEIPSDYLVSEPGESIYLHEIHGFQVFVKGKGKVGSIEGFSSNSVQDLLVVKTVQGEFEIPFVEPFVDRIEYESKEIHLDLPEGLLGDSDDDGHDDDHDEGEKD